MEINERGFGILIAYVIPGWIVLLGLGYVFPVIAEWMSGTVAESPTIGGFLFATLASVGLGVFVSTLRWGIVDRLMSNVGVPPDNSVFAKLRSSYEALSMLIDGHYRYYQFHANLCIALPVAAIFRWAWGTFSWVEFIALPGLLIVLFVGAREGVGQRVLAQPSGLFFTDLS